jgi:hypothetical protein
VLSKWRLKDIHKHWNCPDCEFDKDSSLSDNNFSISNGNDEEKRKKRKNSKPNEKQNYQNDISINPKAKNNLNYSG